MNTAWWDDVLCPLHYHQAKNKFTPHNQITVTDPGLPRRARQAEEQGHHLWKKNWTKRWRPWHLLQSANKIQGGETDHVDPFFNYFTRSSRNVSTARVCAFMWPLLLSLSRRSLLTFLSLLSLLRPRSHCRKYIYLWLARKWPKTPIVTDFDLKFWTTDKITTTW